jgi:hypothetical protein
MQAAHNISPKTNFKNQQRIKAGGDGPLMQSLLNGTPMTGAGTTASKHKVVGAINSVLSDMMAASHQE